MRDGEGLKTEFLHLCEASAVALTARQADLCLLHLQKLLDWNVRHNLTRITHPRELLIKHFLDSLIPGGFLPDREKVLDVGTGAGFPGIPLRLVKSGWDVTLLDARRKKVSFLKVLLPELGLSGLRAVQGRLEEMPVPDSANGQRGENPFTLITVRAVRLDRSFFQSAGAVLSHSGAVAQWAGPEPGAGEEKSAAGGSFYAESAYGYELPEGAGRRRLVVWRRQGEQGV
jgi:16S rRNA (guanine527-N7)-methyltransferase